MHHGGSFKSYMALKNAKLQEQFEANSFQAAPHSSIFQGVSIFVNGYTQPTHAELRQIMLMHGGRFEVRGCACLRIARPLTLPGL